MGHTCSSAEGRQGCSRRPEVSVIIVTYNSAHHVEACLRAISAATSDHLAEVIVVDNASADATVELVGSCLPGVRLFRVGENLGFAQAVNFGASHATGEYLLLTNPDARLHAGAVDALVTLARERPEHGLYGGRAVDLDGTSGSVSCLGTPTLWSMFCFATGLSTAFRGSPIFDPESLGWDRKSEREVPAISGCLLFTTRQLWKVLGGFDPNFFMYGEDIDLALRARTLGFRPVVTPAAALTHHGGGSSATPTHKLVLLLKGKATVLRKHWSPWLRPAGLALLQIGVAVRALPNRLEQSRASPWHDAWKRRGEWLQGYDLGRVRQSR